MRTLIPAILLIAALALPAQADPPHLCFSPDGGCEALVIDAIDSARSTIDVAVFDFTDPQIEDALARAVSRGVEVRMVIDERESFTKSCEATDAEADGVTLRVLHGLGRGGLMHDKFAIIDGRLVETGSFNWTRNAELHNAENAIVLDDPALASRYKAEFDRLWTMGVQRHDVRGTDLSLR